MILAPSNEDAIAQSNKDLVVVTMNLDLSLDQSTAITFNFEDILETSPFASPSTLSTAPSTTEVQSCAGRNLSELCPASLTVDGFQLTRNCCRRMGLLSDCDIKPPDLCPEADGNTSILHAYVYALYYCKERRGKNKCSASLNLKINYMDISDVVKNFKGPHTCGQDNKACVNAKGVLNYAAEMEQAVLEAQRASGPSEPPAKIAERVYKIFEEKAHGELANLASVDRLKIILKNERHSNNKEALVIKMIENMNYKY